MDTSQIASQRCPNPSNDIPCHSESLTASLCMSWRQPPTSALHPHDLLTSSLPLPLPTLLQPRWLPCSSCTHHLCVQLRTWACSILSYWNVHMALYLTASGVCSNVTLLDNSCPAAPQISLPPPSLSLYSALLFVITLAIYCVFTCS